MRTGLSLEAVAKKQLPPDVLEYFRKQGRKGGKKSRETLEERMTPKQRSARASTAAKARWAPRDAFHKLVRRLQRENPKLAAQIDTDVARMMDDPESDWAEMAITLERKYGNLAPGKRGGRKKT